MRDGGDEHLRDSHAAFDRETVLPQVDEGDADFAAVVGIDGAWCVDQGDSVFGGQTAAGTDLRS